MLFADISPENNEKNCPNQTLFKLTEKQRITLWIGQDLLNVPFLGVAIK